MPKSDDAIKALYEVELARLRQKVKDGQSVLNITQKHLRETEDKLADLLGLKDDLADVAPRILRVKKSNKLKESVAIVVASDWHCGERVDASAVNDLNEYNPAIARKRIEGFFQNILVPLEMSRKAGPVNTLVLAVLGDLITGHIHPDLQESNYLTPTEEVLFSAEMLIGGIDFLREHAGFKRILFVGKGGNHGRTTQKMRASMAQRTSYEVMLYRFVEMHYKGTADLSFQIGGGYHDYLDIFGYVNRLHHGHAIKYREGVGGVSIPLLKKIAKWNTKKPHADYDILGHWHQLKFDREFVINGSGIGYTSYSDQLGAGFEKPQQAMFLESPGRGKTACFPVFVD